MAEAVSCMCKEKEREEHAFILAMHLASPVQQALGLCYPHGDLWAGQCQCGWECNFQDDCRTGGVGSEECV